jgi:hypothetical protein
MDDFMKRKSDEQYNPFDDIIFWLQLASSIDFTFDFDESMNTVLDTPASKNQLRKVKYLIPKPANQKRPISSNKKTK